MKRTPLTLVLTALAVATITPASAQRLFGRGGENSPDKTAREEARQAIIDEYDADGDGVLNAAERDAAKEARNALRAERPQTRSRGSRRPSFGGGRPVGAGAGADRAARVQAIIDRMKAAIESGELPEGVTPEQAAEGLATLENALATGQRPDAERPANIVRPEGVGRPDGVGFPGGEARVQSIIARLNTAIESGTLPEGVTAEQAAERVAMLEQALATGVRPDAERPANVSSGRPAGVGGRPAGVSGRPSGFGGRPRG